MNRTMRRYAGRLICGSAAAFVAGALLAPAPVMAQAGAEALGTASPARIEGQILDVMPPPSEIAPIDVRDMPLDTAPEGAAQITFPLTALDVEGVSAYSPAAIEAYYAHLVGTEISLADLYAVAGQITRKYRNDGYILSQTVVPEQTIEGGRAQLRVVEGHVDQITIEGDEPESALRLIRDIAGQLRRENGPLNVIDLERALLLINDLPGIEARSVLGPSRDVVGAADLRIIVDRKPFDALVGMDNYGTRFLGPFQMTGALSLNSAFGYNERLSIQAVTAPKRRELAYGALSYDAPLWGLGEYGTRFQLRGSSTHTRPGYSLREFGVRGKAQNLSLQLSHPFIRSREMNLTGRTSFDYRNVDSSNNIDGDPTRKDRVRMLRVGGRFDFIEDTFGVAYNMIDLQLSRGLDVFGATSSSDDNVSRPDADPRPWILAAEIQRLQRLGPGVNLLMTAQGQRANNAVLSAEEFGFGGMNMGRGYDPSEILGDHGMAGKLELQWNQPQPLSFVHDYQLFGFVDAGRVWNDDATTSDQRRQSLISAGAGVRADFTPQTQGNLTIGVPLNEEPQTRGNKKPRLFLSLTHRF